MFRKTAGGWDGGGDFWVGVMFHTRPGCGVLTKSCSHRRLPLPLGEGRGEGEHTALVVVPFTLRSLLLCYHTTCERVREARRRLPDHPGSRQENRRFADCSSHPWDSPLRGQRKRCPKLLPAILSSAYSSRLSGRAPACIPAGYALSARPCASPRPYGNASAIFGRNRVSR